MKDNNSVLVVGGGIMGMMSAYWLAQKGKSVTLLDQFEVPNTKGASGDHLRVFRLTYGKDAFYTDMAAKSLPLWLDLNTQAGQPLLVQNGVLEFATQNKGYEEQSFQVLKEMKLKVQKLSKDELKRGYSMINSRAVKWALFHPDGGMIWASRATSAVATLAQRRGVKVRSAAKVVAVLKDKTGIKGVKDASGKLWTADSYLFACGFRTAELLKNVPLKITRQFQLYLRPPENRGRYRPEHFPVFAALSAGFYGFPLHIHGFLKVADHRKGPVGKPPADGRGEDAPPAVEKKTRAFLKRFIPDLSGFTEFEGQVCYYDNTKDDDFIIDRLPDAPNGYVAAGFSGHGFKFAPIVGKTVAELMTAGKTELNIQRFRLGRFKKR